MIRCATPWQRSGMSRSRYCASAEGSLVFALLSSVVGRAHSADARPTTERNPRCRKVRLPCPELRDHQPDEPHLHYADHRDPRTGPRSSWVQASRGAPPSPRTPSAPPQQHRCVRLLSADNSRLSAVASLFLVDRRLAERRCASLLGTRTGAERDAVGTVLREICRTVRLALATWHHTFRLCVIGVVMCLIYLAAFHQW